MQEGSTQVQLWLVSLWGIRIHLRIAQVCYAMTQQKVQTVNCTLSKDATSLDSCLCVAVACHVHTQAYEYSRCTQPPQLCHQLCLAFIGISPSTTRHEICLAFISIPPSTTRHQICLAFISIPPSTTQHQICLAFISIPPSTPPPQIFLAFISNPPGTTQSKQKAHVLCPPTAANTAPESS